MVQTCFAVSLLTHAKCVGAAGWAGKLKLAYRDFIEPWILFFEFCTVLNISWVSACLCGIFHNDPLCVRYLIIFRMFVFLHGLYVCCSNKIHSAKTSTRFLQVTWRSGDVHDWTSVIRRTVFCLCHPLHLYNALVRSECLISSVNNSHSHQCD